MTNFSRIIKRTHPCLCYRILVVINCMCKHSDDLNMATHATFTQGCDLRVTFGWRPETWSGRSVVAQTQKVLFLYNCYSTTLCALLERPTQLKWHKRSLKGGRMEARALRWWLSCCRGRRMEAPWSSQWSLNGRNWSAKGGIMVVQGI